MVTVGLATWLLSETLTGVQIIGAVLVLGAVLRLALSHRESDGVPATTPI